MFKQFLTMIWFKETRNFKVGARYGFVCGHKEVRKTADRALMSESLHFVSWLIVTVCLVSFLL